MSVIFGDDYRGIMVSLGIIGVYLARIYDEVKARPRYLVSDDSRNPQNRQTQR